MRKEIKVKNSGVIKLQYFDDFPDGALVIGEAHKNIPFDINSLAAIFDEVEVEPRLPY